MTLQKLLAVGQAVPEITGNALDGSSARLSDFLGKYVLLYLWASNRQDTLSKLGFLRALNDRYGDDPRFTIVGLNLDDAPEAAKKVVTEQRMPWPQIMLNGWDDQRLPREYTLSPAMLFLIDPSGHLLAKNIDVPGAFSALHQVLPLGKAANVEVERLADGQEGRWSTTNGADNVARSAVFSLVDGQSQASSRPLDCLHDGILPGNADAPTQNFFFAGGTLEGRIKIDLGANVSIDRVNTYSWHKSDRGPQIYKVYGAVGDAAGFDPNPKIGIDPLRCGWKTIATADTRPVIGVGVGGRYIVHISSPSGNLGSYRYLLFETFVTETADLWGHTFYSEIEVIRSR